MWRNIRDHGLTPELLLLLSYLPGAFPLALLGWHHLVLFLLPPSVALLTPWQHWPRPAMLFVAFLYRLSCLLVALHPPQHSIVPELSVEGTGGPAGQVRAEG